MPLQHPNDLNSGQMLQARVQAERFESGVASLWNVPVLDPLPGVHTLLHRPATYALLEAITCHLGT
jgi:hypothetical protein